MALQGTRVPAPRARPGVFASLRRLGGALLATVHSRVELLAHELERERLRVTRLLILAVAALFFLALGAITATIFVVVLFWDSQRLVVIGFLTLLYLGLGLGILAFTRNEAARSKRPFSSTAEQFRKDREHFAGPSSP